MQIKKILTILYRIILLIGCFIGIYLNSGLKQGFINPQMFCFYTILSNLICLIFFAYLLFKNTVQKDFRSPRFKGAITLMITVTFLIYHFVLLPQSFTMNNYNPFSLADVLVHYFTPLMTIFDWLIFDEKNKYKVIDPILWLSIPLAYFLFAMIRAQFGGVLTAIGSKYPYFFMDVDLIGIHTVMINVVVLIIAFLLLGYMIYFIDKFNYTDKKIYFGNKCIFKLNI